MTPRRSLRSDLLYDDTEGARDSCPFIQCPKPDPIRFGSPFSVPSGSGPSMRGVSVSPRGRRLTDLATEESGLGLRFLRRRRPVMGETVRAGLVEREREGESPRTTSSLRAEKKPCFFSIWKDQERESVKKRIGN